MKGSWKGGQDRSGQPGTTARGGTQPLWELSFGPGQEEPGPGGQQGWEDLPWHQPSGDPSITTASSATCRLRGCGAQGREKHHHAPGTGQASSAARPSRKEQDTALCARWSASHTEELCTTAPRATAAAEDGPVAQAGCRGGWRWARCFCVSLYENVPEDIWWLWKTEKWKVSRGVGLHEVVPAQRPEVWGPGAHSKDSGTGQWSRGHPQQSRDCQPRGGGTADTRGRGDTPQQAVPAAPGPWRGRKSQVGCSSDSWQLVGSFQSPPLPPGRGWGRCITANNAAVLHSSSQWDLPRLGWQDNLPFNEVTGFMDACMSPTLSLSPCSVIQFCSQKFKSH